MANNEMNQKDRASETESAQQMVELKRPLLSQQQQQQKVYDDVTVNIKEMIQDCGDGRLVPDCCIYRVPIKIRDLKEDAYTPTVVSIGPLHYGNKRLQDMERYKQIMFKRFTQRAHWLSLDDLVGRTKNLEPKVRASYSETINLSEQELVKLTLVDAAFIIELLIMWYEMDELQTDAKLSQPWLSYCMHQDLILIENQLPFFAIEELYNEAFRRFDRWDRPNIDLPPFLDLVYEYFWCYNRQSKLPTPNLKVRHFTDLLRLFYLPGKMSERQSSSRLESHILLYNANALKEAGVKLKASTSKCLLDLKFSGHNVLEIPQIKVEDGTEELFRNMIALEQCHYSSAAYITDYAIAMDFLIETNKDADILIQEKIVLNYVGESKNVALLFDGLTKCVNQPTFSSDYLDIFQRLNGYCQDPWHQMKATLRSDYCRTPWQILASIAAILLLFLTVVQTIFSILQVVE